MAIVYNREPFDGTPNRWDWLFAAQMLSAQESGDWGKVVVASQAMSSGVLYLQKSLFGGAYSSVIFVSSRGLNVVSILGTQSPLQLVGELAASTLVPFDGLPGRVSAYFAVDLLFVLQGILATVNPAYPTVFVGHSLGGATAELLASYLSNTLGKSVQAVYTLGAPCPGDAAFASTLGMPVLRLEAAGDIVPSVPQPLGVFLSAVLHVPSNPDWSFYTQAGSAFTLAADGSIAAGHTQLTPAQILGIVLAGEVSTHYVQSYIQRLALNSQAPGNLVPGANGYEKPWTLVGLVEQPLAVPANTSADYVPQYIRPLLYTGMNEVSRSGKTTVLSLLPDYPPQSWVPQLTAAGQQPGCCTP